MPRAPKSSIPDFSVFAERFTAHALRVAEKALREFAEEQAAAATHFQQLLLSGAEATLGVKPLAWSTIKRKSAYHLRNPAHPLVATGTYAHAIRVNKVTTNDRNVVRFVIGLDPAVKPRHYDGSLRTDGTTLEDIARIHEYGAPKAGIPARPHWAQFNARLRPMAAKLREKLPDLVMSTWQP